MHEALVGTWTAQKPTYLKLRLVKHYFSLSPTIIYFLHCGSSAFKQVELCTEYPSQKTSGCLYFKAGVISRKGTYSRKYTSWRKYINNTIYWKSIARVANHLLWHIPYLFVEKSQLVVVGLFVQSASTVHYKLFEEENFFFSSMDDSQYIVNNSKTWYITWCFSVVVTL